MISIIFSDHNRMKLKTNHRKRNKKKKSDCVETKKHDTKKPMVIDEIKEIIEYPEKKTMKTKLYKNLCIKK